MHKITPDLHEKPKQGKTLMRSNLHYKNTYYNICFRAHCLRKFIAPKKDLQLRSTTLRARYKRLADDNHYLRARYLKIRAIMNKPSTSLLPTISLKCSSRDSLPQATIWQFCSNKFISHSYCFTFASSIPLQSTQLAINLIYIYIYKPQDLKTSIRSAGTREKARSH